MVGDMSCANFMGVFEIGAFSPNGCVAFFECDSTNGCVALVDGASSAGCIARAEEVSPVGPIVLLERASYELDSGSSTWLTPVRSYSFEKASERPGERKLEGAVQNNAKL